ncbi:MAG: ribonuclease HII [Rickettsiales bacterium]|jgi:ribonuclease HII|nr:ribonuclease HII [Rickettsiales bacterium]
MKTFPTFDIENETGGIVAGVDEAGRGPLCGPVVAAAVVIPARAAGCAINDSKKMTRAARAAAYDWIMKNCAVGIGQCSAAEIDGMNILQASLTAMKRAIANLPQPPDFILVDGNRLPDGVVGRAVVGGDAKSLSIAAASIIAKETRDNYMADLARQFPQYGWDKNAGYPTKSHLAAIAEYGINSHYRKTYKPVKEALCKSEQ